MKAVLLVLAGSAVSVLAFPPFGPGLVVVLGVALFLTGLREARSGKHGFGLGYLYGLVFFGGLMWWLTLLHWTALALIPVQALYPGVLGWWMGRNRHLEGSWWAVLAVCSWALLELIRYRFPVGGTEWGAIGYATSDLGLIRSLAPIVGTSGITVLLVGVAALIAVVVRKESATALTGLIIGPLALTVILALWAGTPTTDSTEPFRATIVQGSTPCPFGSCPPNQRFHTFEQHLELTRTIEEGLTDLVVWPESSTGSTNADPVNNSEVGQAIGDEARRIGAWMLIGGDRPLSDTHWVNVNVLFSPDGEVVDEYQKQHPVPFGEYIPWRPFFTWLIPELYRVPRDMIPGDRPVVFDLDGVSLGSVISWEGGFSRYARAHVRQDAQVMVVATNNDSYSDTAPTSVQFMGMTRMRAAELGVPMLHAAVSGKSVVIDRHGRFVAGPSELGASELVRMDVTTGTASWYARTGDVVMVAFALLGVAIGWRARTLVSSSTRADEEE